MFAWALFAGALSVGCDIGPRDDSPAHGPALHLVASYPADGQGTKAARGASLDCTAPTPQCPVPTNVSLELRFDRFLLPGAGLAAGLHLYTGEPVNALALTAEYDLIERVVVLRTARALQPNTLYTAEFTQTSDPYGGFRAFDRAPLEKGDVPLRFSFLTGKGPAKVATRARVASNTCDTISSGPLAACVDCHSTREGNETSPPSKYPPMGLDLSSTPGLFYTAVSHVAHQTETGETAANQGLQLPLRFGVQMNVVDPGYPASSYLMYKLLQKPENFRLGPGETSCGTGYHAPVSDGDCQPPSADEAEQLREWFVRGEGMPKNRYVPGQPATVASITHADLLNIAGWIADGAPCADPR